MNRRSTRQGGDERVRDHIKQEESSDAFDGGAAGCTGLQESSRDLTA